LFTESNHRRVVAYRGAAVFGSGIALVTLDEETAHARRHLSDLRIARESRVSLVNLATLTLTLTLTLTQALGTIEQLEGITLTLTLTLTLT